MKCSSCTTELWGRPAVCPVCGTPTGLNKRSSRQTPPPWTPSAPATPPPPPSPPRTASQSQPLFNAADLLDPAVLDAVPHAPPATNAADIFSTGPLSEGRLAPEPPQGTINAADLFDPQVLADLTGGAEEGRSFQNRAEAPARDDYPSFAEAEDDYEDDDEGDYPPVPSPPAARGPIAPPLFSLTALPATGPQPTLPPPFPPPPSFPLEDDESDALPMPRTDAPAWNLQNGYRTAPRPPTLGASPNRPSMPPPPGMYPAGPYPMPAPPASKVGARPASRKRPFFSTLGGFFSLLLVLAIVGGAILFGASRYFQLQALQPKPSPTTVAPVPTVAPLSGYTIFPDQKLGFSLQYANIWQKKTDQDKNDAGYQGDLFFAGTDPGFNTGFEVGSSPQYASMSPAQIDDYVLANPFPLTNISSIQTYASASPTIHILNLDWTAEDADVVANGVSLRMTCLAIIHNGRGYTIFYFSPQEVFSNDYAQYFQPMLISFRFLND